MKKRIHNDELFLVVVNSVIKIAYSILTFGIIALIIVFYYNVLAPQQEILAQKKKVKEIELLKIAEAEKNNPIQNGIHVNTGFVSDKGLNIVIATCTACHSAKIVTQNKATKEGWLEMIRWMQKTQNLWDLGDNEEIILDYLAKNYGPDESGRRKNLVVTEWYELK